MNGRDADFRARNIASMNSMDLPPPDMPFSAKFGPWLELTSSSGRVYYYNRVTEQSKWQKPQEWVENDKIQDQEKEKTITPPPIPPILTHPPVAPLLFKIPSPPVAIVAPVETIVETFQNDKPVSPTGSEIRETSVVISAKEKRGCSEISSASNSYRRRSYSRSTSRSSMSPPAKRSRTYTSSYRSSRSSRTYRSMSRRSSTIRSRSQSSESTYRRRSFSDKGSEPMDTSTNPSPAYSETPNVEPTKEDETSVIQPTTNGYAKKLVIESNHSFDDLSDGAMEDDPENPPVECYTEEQLESLLSELGVDIPLTEMVVAFEMDKELHQIAVEQAVIAKDVLDVVKDRISVVQMATVAQMECDENEARATFCKEQANALAGGL